MPESYKKLIVWSKAMDLVVLIYKLTEAFPRNEAFGLVSQMRRAAVSVPSNIAEGKYRSSQKDFSHFLHIAYASGAELETQLEIAKRLGFIELRQQEEISLLLEEVMKMLNTLLSGLKAKS